MVLAFAVNDPAFGFLYVASIAVLTAALVFGSALALRWVRVVQLVACLLLGFFLGVAATGALRDVSGTPPVAVAPPLKVETVGGAGTPASPPRAGAPDGQISIDAFDAGERKSDASGRITLKSGEVVTVSGWAFDAQAGTPCGALDVAVDGKPQERLKYGLPRTDVVAFYKDSAHLATGFTGTVSTQGWRPGEHRVLLRCVDVTANVAHPASQPRLVTVTK
jgi:hypothetical protein